ncbi:MAG: FAD-dependent oxidoreductase [Candidatus Bathyarchaeota archaeon]|nr:FAD-dependent oxidoreductase [Candidatus Bathyarchaeota archaeon]MDH5688739.1 FAD-dependent oxidoreductase [Candidatus Bathyarchaeota archaeon]
MSKYVIVGGSAGGIGAVEAIREVDPIGTIVVISEEPFPQYSRPMIADFLSGEVILEKMKYRGDLFWEKNEIRALTGNKAVSLNLVDRYVELEGGGRINFEKLLIATGGKPFVPDMEGADKDGVFTFTKFSDAERIVKKIGAAEKVVVIGGGLIGVSAAEALTKCGLEVTIVELKDRILNLILDEAASEIVENVIREAGVIIVTGQTVKRILGRPENDSVVGGVVLTNGEEVPCDLVIIAIGVIPHTELVVGTEVKVNRGIIVDRFMRTSVPYVYACGDVAEAYDFVLDESRPLPLWSVAHLGGRVAGYNMAGKKTGYPGGTSMSALKYFDMPVISAGISNSKEGDGYEVLVNHDPERNLYKKVVLKDSVVVGMVFVNEIERTGILFYLMKNRVNVECFKHNLVSEDFGLVSLPEQLRRRMLLGK